MQLSVPTWDRCSRPSSMVRFRFQMAVLCLEIEYVVRTKAVLFGSLVRLRNGGKSSDKRCITLMGFERRPTRREISPVFVLYKWAKLGRSMLRPGIEHVRPPLRKT